MLVAPLGKAFAYFESWFDVPLVLGAPFGCQYGVFSFPTDTYNQTSSCTAMLTDNQIFTSTNKTYVAQPDASGFINVLPETGLFMESTGASCVFRRVIGPACTTLLAVLERNLTTGVPRKGLSYDRALICNPY